MFGHVKRNPAPVILRKLVRERAAVSNRKADRARHAEAAIAPERRSIIAEELPGEMRIASFASWPEDLLLN